MTRASQLVGKRVRVYIYDCHDRLIGLPVGRVSALATAVVPGSGARKRMVYVTDLLPENMRSWKPGAGWFPVGTVEVIDP